jgi:hypothetical protein
MRPASLVDSEIRPLCDRETLEELLEWRVGDQGRGESAQPPPRRRFKRPMSVISSQAKGTRHQGKGGGTYYVSPQKMLCCVHLLRLDSLSQNGDTYLTEEGFSPPQAAAFQGEG